MLLEHNFCDRGRESNEEILQENGATNASTKMSRLTRKPGNAKERAIPFSNEVRKNLMDLMASDLITIAKALRKPIITHLCLFLRHNDLRKKIKGSESFGFLGYRHTETVLTFCRALAWAISRGGCLQELELGFGPCERDLKLLNASLCQARALKRLSFSNSELGDQKLQLLSKGLQECSTLEILDLSNCALTDAVVPLLGSILKANVCRKAQADWEASLRNNKRAPSPTRKNRVLAALDVSYNKLSDVTTQDLCSVLRVGAPLEALNLRGNRLSRISGKLLLDVMRELGSLHLVDLRENLDSDLMCVLEDNEHLTAFSRPHPPFWCDSPTVGKFKMKQVKKKVSDEYSRPRSVQSSDVTNCSSDLKKIRKINASAGSQRQHSLTGQAQNEKNSIFSAGGSVRSAPSSMGSRHSPTFIQSQQSDSYSLSTSRDICGQNHGDESAIAGNDLALHMSNMRRLAATMQSDVVFGLPTES
eukprot:Gb_24812 [translate_table: standard]